MSSFIFAKQYTNLCRRPMWSNRHLVSLMHPAITLTPFVVFVSSKLIWSFKTPSVASLYREHANRIVSGGSRTVLMHFLIKTTYNCSFQFMRCARSWMSVFVATNGSNHMGHVFSRTFHFSVLTSVPSVASEFDAPRVVTPVLIE